MPKRKSAQQESQNSDSGDDEPAPPTKKSNTGSEPETNLNNSHNEQSGETSLQANSSGEKFMDLGKKKRATVRTFKGTPLIDIREYYGTGNELQPGKKGISLTIEQWEALKKSSSLLDEALSSLKTK